MEKSQNLIGTVVMPSPFVRVLVAFLLWLRKD